MRAYIPITDPQRLMREGERRTRNSSTQMSSSSERWDDNAGDAVPCKVTPVILHELQFEDAAKPASRRRGAGVRPALCV